MCENDIEIFCKLLKIFDTKIMFFVFFLLSSGLCRRKKKISSGDPDDQPVREAPEYGRVWIPDPKHWGHFVGREPCAVVAFVQNDPAGKQLAYIMNEVINLIDMSKLNVVIAQAWDLAQICDDQDINEFPTVRFYKSGQKRWSTIFEGYYTSKAIAKWAMDQVRELDEWENDND